MNFLWPLLIQCVALLVVIELFVRCMPTALRRASQNNCYRVDGTRSDHRTYREWRAHNRLRRDMLAVLILVFLTGNALYYTIEAPADKVAVHLGQRWFGSARSQPAALLTRDQALDIVNQDETLSVDKVNRILYLTLAWATASFGFLGWGAFRAYKSFAEGVNARSAEHFHLDMTRISISDSQIVQELAGKSDPSQGVA